MGKVIGFVIVFLTISVVSLTIYITKKEPSQNTIKSSNNSHKMKKTSSKQNLKDIWGIADIRDGIVFLDKRRNTAVLRLGSIAFDLLSLEEQDVVENVLIQAGVAFDFPFQLFSTTEGIDTRAVIEDIQTSMYSEPSIKGLTYCSELVRNLDDMMKNKSIYVRKNYIAISYDGDKNKAYVELERICETVISTLMRANIKVQRLSSDEIVDLLFNTINRGSSSKPSSIIEDGGMDLYNTGLSRFK